MNKLFLTINLVILSTSLSTFASSEIVDVRRNITLSDEEAPIKDFYIKIGDSAGLKKNLVVKAIRKINVKDSGQKNIGDFLTTVGLVKIIHVEGKVAVAREYKLVPRDNEPMLEQIGIMTGDEIDLSESFVDTAKPKTSEIKKKVAEEVIENKADVAVVVIEKTEPIQIEVKPETLQGI